MGWLLFAGVAFAVLLRVVRRRRALFTVSPTEPISTVHIERSKKQTAKERAALEAATATLR